MTNNSHTKSKKIWNNVIKVLLTLTAMYWLTTKISFKEVKSALLSSNYFILFGAVITYSISILISSSRLNSFFKCIGLNLSERHNLRLYQLGLLYNFFLPGGIGGDGYKIFFLKKRHNIRGRKVLSAVFFDRLSGLWALFIIICVLVLFIPRFAIPNYLTIAVACLGSFTYYYFFHLFFKKFTRNFFSTHFKALCVQSLQVFTAILILIALGFEGKFAPYLLIFLLSSLVAIIPSIGGGIGLRELMSIYSADYIKLDPQLAVTLSLIFYLISLLIAASGVYYVFRPERLGIKRLPTAEEVKQEADN
ncbi:MAG TPA: lysylphosphatidylglycerol synthase transmembrane domain-containing protein [Sphingobacterium sp.]|nr:lysylphosphatidylglycerol synthase transmembrane domain-containing protein [Sphingobacterium sp.]